MNTRWLSIAVVAVVALPLLGSAQSPPERKTAPPPTDEDAEFFGGDDEADPDDKAFDGEKSDPPIKESTLIALDDKLQIGGFMYLRSNWNFVDSKEVEDHRISLPSLVELYLDGRPTDRIRGFVRGRLGWDPTLSDGATDLLGQEVDEVSVLLDELWLKFDIERVVYLTIGQQKVRWGTTRLWNPVDVINLTRRAPLDLFDLRTGVPAVKLHFPVESLGWNFYVLGMMDDVTSIEKAGVAARAEFVFSTVEMGLTGAYRKGVDPKVGLDFSAGVWDVDVMGEVSVRLDEAKDLEPVLQVSAGLQYGLKYSDEDVMYMGVEYFYNQAGHDSVEDAIRSSIADTPLDQLDSGLPFPQFFYVGKHYGAVFISLIAPGSWNDTNITLSTVGNFSDMSFVSRLDYSVRVLTFMTVQAFVMGHYGQQGELRFGNGAFGTLRDEFNPILEALGQPTLNVNTPLIDVGLNLRIDI